jgi:Na+-driven multidrug efflux pump
MTQGVLPLIAYNYASGNKKRLFAIIKTTSVLTLSFAGVATIFLYFCATPVTKLFIGDALTVRYGREFLKIVAIACPITAVNCIAITIFQAMGKKVQPLILSVSRKGVADIPFMFLFNGVIGLFGIPWAVPTAEGVGLIFSVTFLILLFKKIKKDD